MKRILKDLRLGIHTYEVGQTLTKKQFGAALERMRARGRVVPGGKGWRSCTLLDGRQRHIVALTMAVVTAPWTFLIPLYNY